MGTNYYAIPKITHDLKERIGVAIDEGRLDDARNMIPQRVHIGKSSMGWDFLFNHNNYEYFKNSAEMFEWLRDCEIVDEYQEHITFPDFLEMVNSKKRSQAKMTNPNWYKWDGGYVFSDSTEFS